VRSIACCSFCLSVCRITASSQPISPKLVMIAPTNRENWLTFGGDGVPNTDSRSLSKFPYRCGIGDFIRFSLLTYST